MEKNMNNCPPKIDDQMVLDSCAVDTYSDEEILEIIERGRYEFRSEWFRYVEE